jgi:integrase
MEFAKLEPSSTEKSMVAMARFASKYGLLGVDQATGVPGAVCGLSREDIDLEKSRLSVRRALIPHGDGVITSEPKTAKGRRQIALDAATVEALKA